MVRVGFVLTAQVGPLLFLEAWPHYSTFGLPFKRLSCKKNATIFLTTLRPVWLAKALKVESFAESMVPSEAPCSPPAVF